MISVCLKTQKLSSRARAAAASAAAAAGFLLFFSMAAGSREGNAEIKLNTLYLNTPKICPASFVTGRPHSGSNPHGGKPINN